MQVLDNATNDGNVLGYVKLSKKGECEIEGDEEHHVSAVEWKKLSDQAKGTLPKQVRSSEGAVRQGCGDLPRERRHKGEGRRSAEEGNAAAERVQESLQGQGCSEETRWWSLRSAPGREAGGDQEESAGGPQDHRRDQESW